MAVKRIKPERVSQKKSGSSFVPTEQQENIFKTIRDSNANLIVAARAGTGKTTTMLESLQYLPPNSKVLMLAFNAAIAQELKNRLSLCNPKVSRLAQTFHGLGFSYIRSAYPGENIRVNSRKTENLLEELTGNKPSGPHFYFSRTVENLVSHCKNSLLRGSVEDLQRLRDWYDLNFRYRDEEIYETVPRVLTASRSQDTISKYGIDFDDMLWIPCINELFPSDPPYTEVYVDEAQDLNPCQHSLCLYAGIRIIAVGDEFQAIYGFRGADAESMNKMRSILSKESRGYIELPLTQSRRCPEKVVDLVHPIVPDFEALPGAPEGLVQCLSPERIVGTLQQGDMVLSRVNAPLCSLAYRLIKSRKKATIRGRDIGAGLVDLIKKVLPNPSPGRDGVRDLSRSLLDHYNKEYHRITSQPTYSNNALTSLSDRVDCIAVFSKGAESVEEIRSTITEIFQDPDPAQPTPGVLLSSIHRAKGLEAQKVFILSPELIPHPLAKQRWEVVQEHNLGYVAATRAISELTFVGAGIPRIFGPVLPGKYPSITDDSPGEPTPTS